MKGKYSNEAKQLIMDNNIAEAKSAAFIPIEGMQPAPEGNRNGYKGVIEYVGKDYFILRSFKTDEPVLIKPFQYHNFVDYVLPEAKNISDELLKHINTITDQYKKIHNL